MAITTTDTDGQSLIRLMTWLSPAFPVGGFAYSAGLERAAHDGLVEDSQALAIWLEAMLQHGAWWNDAILLAAAWRAAEDVDELRQLSDLAEALAGSAERHLEITMQGEAFAAASSAWPDPVLTRLGARPPYSIAVGAIAAAHGVPVDRTLGAYLHALSSQAVSAGIRLSILGQRQGVEVLAGLERTILAVATRASASAIDDLGSATVMADLAAIRHETQHSRIFRS